MISQINTMEVANMEIWEYKGNYFGVIELEDCFQVIIDDEDYVLNSLADVHEFIENYNLIK
jgi:hypothetical protein